MDGINVNDGEFLNAAPSLKLLDLTKDLLLIILQDLDFLSLLNCQRVCWFLYSVISESTPLQLTIELAASGLELGPPSTDSAADRLSALRKYRAAWDALNFTDDMVIDMERGAVWELLGGVLAQAKRTSQIVFRQLPAFHRGIQYEVWETEDLGFTIRDFTMDPSQDLLVVIEHGHSGYLSRTRSCLVHFLTMRTNKPHPKAARSLIEALSMENRLDADNYIILVSGQYLGIMHRGWHLDADATKHLVIHDWTSGERIMWLEDEVITSFAFLTDRHVLVATMDNTLIVIDFLEAGDERTSLDDQTEVFTLSLPWTDEPGTLEIRSDPPVTWSPTMRVPFYTSGADRLYVISIHTTVIGPEKSTFFIPAKTILAYIPGPSQRCISCEQFEAMFTLHSPVWCCCIYGQRYVETERGDMYTLDIVDFNQYAIRRHLKESPEKVCALGGALQRFRPPVRSDVPETWSAVMCNEDNLIIVYDSSVSPLKKFRILSL